MEVSLPNPPWRKVLTELSSIGKEEFWGEVESWNSQGPILLKHVAFLVYNQSVF